MKNFLSGLRDGLRVVVMSLVAWLLTDGVIAFLVDATTGAKLDAQTRIILMSGLTAVLKGLEKWFYKEQPDNKVSEVLEFKSLE